MILLILFLLLSAAYGAIYGVRCLKRKRAGSGVAVLTLLLLPVACAYVFIRYLIR